MSDIIVCREEEFNATRPCFTYDGNCIAVKIKECGLELEGIPENEETKEFFNAARLTGFKTVLSREDAVKFAEKTVPVAVDLPEGSYPSEELYRIKYQDRLRLVADRFMATAESMIHKMRTGK